MTTTERQNLPRSHAPRVEAAAHEAAPPPEREHDQDGGAAESDLIARLAAKDKVNEVLRGALEDLYVAVNPDDRISRAAWNERLKAATIVARTALLLAEAERADV